MYGMVITPEIIRFLLREGEKIERSERIEEEWTFLGWEKVSHLSIYWWILYYVCNDFDEIGWFVVWGMQTWRAERCLIIDIWSFCMNILNLLRKIYYIKSVHNKKINIRYLSRRSISITITILTKKCSDVLNTFLWRISRCINCCKKKFNDTIAEKNIETSSLSSEIHSACKIFCYQR